MNATFSLYGIQDRNSYPSPGYTHDHSLCLMEGGEVDQYLHLERLTRRKYDNQLHLYLEQLIDQKQLQGAAEADWVFVNSFVGTSFISQNGRFRAETQFPTKLMLEPVRMQAWGEFVKWESKEISAFSLPHELAHIGSNLPFYGSFMENSLHVHFDGGASLSNCSLFLFRNGKFQIIDYNWKLTYLSKFFNDNALVFAMLNQAAGEHCAVPGKLMGFATVGKANEELAQWLKQNAYFKDIWIDKAEFFEKAKADFGWKGKIGDTHDVFLQDVAACFQHIFTEDWLEFLAEIQKAIHADFLYLSGGCALNIVANTRIVNSGLFQDVFIPPCPGDSGLSLGGAAYFSMLKNQTTSLHSPYLNNFDLQQTAKAYDLELVKRVGELIANGNIIGLHQGAGEIGPRALGNRSILARPDSKDLAQRISMTCKRREWYRPIAPVMLEKNAMRYTGAPSIHHLSQYMLLDFEIMEEARTEIEGVVHSNGTARIQTLFSKSQNPFLWDLLQYVEETHQIRALVNTSFNAQGEPMVHTQEQAIESAERMGLDAVVSNRKAFGLELTILN